MNVKQMGADELRNTIEAYDKQVANDRPMNKTDQRFYDACKRELARRWGIRLPRLKRPEEGEIL